MKKKLTAWFLVLWFLNYGQDCTPVPNTSIIPNPSFETYSNCPTSFSQLNVATPWIQATSATTDYYNTDCSFVAASIAVNGLNNYPHGKGIVAALYLRDWNEYLGTTLLSPMLAGTSYQLTMKIAALTIGSYGGSTPTPITAFEPVNVTIYGCANGSNLPLNTVYSPSVADPTWVVLGHALYTPAAIWGDLTIQFTPSIDVNAIMIGAPPTLPSSYKYNSESTDMPYFLYDNLLLNTASSFGVNISSTGSYCEENLVLNANLTANFSGDVSYQWFFNGTIIPDETNAAYSVPNLPTSIGTYYVEITNGEQCFRSASYTVNNSLAGPSFSVVQPTCITSTGSITITTAAAEYSFDNGLTWQNDPTKNLVPVGIHFIKIKTNIGCISASIGVAVIEPDLLSGSELVIVHPTTCDGDGSITVISNIAAQYSFDNGITWTTNNTATNLPSGDYIIRIKDIDDCQSASQFVTLYPVVLDFPEFTYVNPTCGVGGSITITTPAEEYSFDDGLTWQTSNTIDNLTAGYYLIKIRNSTSCMSYSAYLYLEDFQNIYPNYTIEDAGCGKFASITINTPGDEFSFDGGWTWTTNPVLENLNNGDSVQIIVKKLPNCLTQINYITIYSTYFPIPLANDYTYTICDDLNDNTERVDLSLSNTHLIADFNLYTFSYFEDLISAENNSSSGRINNFTNYNLNFDQNTIYVRVTSSDNCFKVVELTILKMEAPIINNIMNEYFLCRNSSVIIYAENIFDTYLWSNGSTNYGTAILTPGPHWVTVTKDHVTPTGLITCSSTLNFNVTLSEPARIINIDTTDWTENNNTITVFSEGIGNYVYSIDGVNYQSSNQFTNLTPGQYSVYINDLSGCGEVNQLVYLLYYQKYFTPNGDGYNDVWFVKFSEMEPAQKITIFDRHGKVVKILNHNEREWNGLYNGIQLPSSDYWFLVEREDGRVHKGHFSLKR